MPDTPVAAAPPWLAAMREISGTRETPGAGDNAVIIGWARFIAQRFPRMQSYAATYRHDSIAWCGLTVAYCMARAGIEPPFAAGDTGKFLWARAWANWGTRLPRPVIGCVVVLTRAGGGHVAILEEETPTHYRLRGGNQGDAVNVASFPKSMLVAAVWPAGVPLPQPAIAQQESKTMAPNYPSMQQGYGNLWDRAAIAPDKAAAAANLADAIIAHRDTYQAIEEKTGVPWFLVGAWHNRESSLSFKGHLHNGDPLTARTVHVPAGRPKAGAPPFAFDESAIDALTMPPHALDTVGLWSVERMLYESERYNGFGYVGKSNSPYVWSWTSEQQAGKYVADGRYSPTTWDRQAGVAAVLKAIARRDPTVATRLELRQRSAPAEVVANETARPRALRNAGGATAAAGGGNEVAKVVVPDKAPVPIAPTWVSVNLVIIGIAVAIGGALAVRAAKTFIADKWGA